jgi:2-iminoacetate synthase
LGLVSHAVFLLDRFGCGPHTISFPRLRPAENVNINDRYSVNDKDFKKLVAILRLAVPYTGMILTARESPKVRKELMAFGVSQIDAGSNIEMGGYSKGKGINKLSNEQFSLGDTRGLDEIILELLQNDYIPSFCTSCYRLGRTGEQFMEFAIPGFISNFCTPNGLLTLTEYLLDYGNDETRKAGSRIIRKELERFDNDKLKQQCMERLSVLETSSERDLYF